MATQFGPNLLSIDAADWVLSNATLTDSVLTVQAGGSAYTEVTELNGTNLLPESFCISLKAQAYGSKYAPTAFVHLQITYIDDNTFDALVPVINKDDGICSVLYPTVSNYDIKVSAFKQIKYTIYSSTVVNLTEFTLQKSLNDTLLEDKLYYGVQISTEKGLQIKKSDDSAEALFNADTLSMRSLNEAGQMEDAIYFDTAKRQYRISGAVAIDGSMSSDAVFTDSLYAEQGDISQLTVDWLDTSKRVLKYLNKDTGNDDYIRAHDSKLEFVTAQVIFSEDGEEPLTEELRNRYGEKVYWQKDISDATIVGGYPYVDGERVYTQTDKSDFPVVVYQYNSLVKRAIDFQLDADSGIYLPVDIFGVGTTAEHPTYGKMTMTKFTDGFVMEYLSSRGIPVGAYFRDDGFVDWKGRRADIEVDTANNKFIITPEGSYSSPYEIDYTNISNGIRMTWPDGESFTVEVN